MIYLKNYALKDGIRTTWLEVTGRDDINKVAEWAIRANVAVSWDPVLRSGSLNTDGIFHKLEIDARFFPLTHDYLDLIMLEDT